MKSKNVAIRSSNFVEARFALSSKQNDILDILFSQIDNDDKLTYEIPIDKYKSIYKSDTSNIYRDFKKAIKSFEKKGFYLYDVEKDEEIYYAWFTKIRYINKEGRIEVDIHKDLKALMYDTKQKIYYDIFYTLNFSSSYSKRMYYYLKMFEDTGWRKDAIEDLAKKLECPQSYKIFRNLDKYVLQVAKNEINSLSDLLIDYSVEKVGRKPVYVKFTIKNKKELLSNKEIVVDLDLPDAIVDLNFVKNIVLEQITEEDRNKLIKICADINYNKEKYKSITDYFIKKYNIAKKYYYNTINQDGTFIAILISALKEDWGDNKVKVKKKSVENKTKKQGHFNNFEQRQYDLSPNGKMERMLLGWDDED